MAFESRKNNDAEAFWSSQAVWACLSDKLKIFMLKLSADSRWPSSLYDTIHLEGQGLRINVQALGYKSGLILSAVRGEILR